MTKQETLRKGVGVAKDDFTKTFKDQSFFTCKGIIFINTQLQITVKVF